MAKERYVYQIAANLRIRSPLNARQEAFARNIADGRSQREKASGPRSR